MVSGSLSLPSRVLFTVPSQYYALSVTKSDLALRGPRVFPQGFSCLVVLWIPCRSRFRLRAFTLLWPAFPKAVPATSRGSIMRSEPGRTRPRFRLFRVRSPLLTESLVVFSSSGYLDVSVRRVPLPALWIGAGMHEGFSCGFPPFRHLRIKGYLPFPGFFTRTSRLSSALSAKASTICSFWHDQADLSARAAPCVLRRHSVAGVGQSAFFYSLPRIWFV